MRRLVLAAGVVCAAMVFAGRASTQVGPSPNTMPGQVVGTGVNYNLNQVGSQVPKAAPQAGKPINLPASSPLMRPYDPNRPYDVFKGTNLSADQLSAPVIGAGDQSTISHLYDQLKSVIGFKTPTMAAAPPHSTYFPSLTRRNRERAEARLWRRD